MELLDMKQGPICSGEFFPNMFCNLILFRECRSRGALTSFRRAPEVAFPGDAAVVLAFRFVQLDSRPDSTRELRAATEPQGTSLKHRTTGCQSKIQNHQGTSLKYRTTGYQSTMQIQQLGYQFATQNHRVPVYNANTTIRVPV